MLANKQSKSQTVDNDPLGEYTRTTLEIEAGYCHNCRTSLLHKQSLDNGLHQYCMPCAKKLGRWF
jgi:hypothetical protein